MLITKHIGDFDLKARTTAAGTFEGWLSKYNDPDSVNDIIEPGSYQKTLKDNGNKVPLLWQHRSDTPLGMLTLEDRAEGLWAKGQLLMELPEAQKAHALIRASVVTGLSIGFEAIRQKSEGGVRRLKEIKLYEGSIVTFPCLNSARIETVKSNFNTGAVEFALKSFRDELLRELKGNL